MTQSKVLLIGYSGHAYTVIESVLLSDMSIVGYCDVIEKVSNPYNLSYLGNESEDVLCGKSWHVSIGDNAIREKLYNTYQSVGSIVTVIDPTANIRRSADIGAGSYIAPGAIINAMSIVSPGCIVNTGAQIDHECHIGSYAHIAPGSILAGGVHVGDRALIGAGAIVREGVNIGHDVIVGAGAVVISDISSHVTVVGNPAKLIQK